MPAELPQEYLEHVKNTVNWLEALGDGLTGNDERLDYIVQQIADLPLANIPKLQVAVETLQLQVVALTNALEAAGIEVEMPKDIRVFRIQQNVPLNTGMILTQRPPFDGYIKELKIHWPPGCNGFVDVRVGHGPKQFCPVEGFLSLDNVTPTYPFNEYVVHTENIWVEIQNTDGLNAHTISVMINIVEK